MKLIWLLVLASLACKLISRRWPWEFLTGTVRSRHEDRARLLLGLERGASREDIIEAHRRLIAVVHPDRGGTHDQVIEANSARDVLLTGLNFRKPPRL